MRKVPLAWLQLRREKLRLLAAVSGVMFAVILIFVQLGFQDALFDSAARYHSTLGYDLAMISPKTDFIVATQSFPRGRVFQARGVPGVEAVAPIHLGLARLRNPVDPEATREIFVLGFDPSDQGVDIPGVSEMLDQIRIPDRVLFDRLSRREFGPIAELVARDGRTGLEVNDRNIDVVGTFEMGTSFGIDGSLVTSDLNFRRIFPDRPASHADLGLLHLSGGADPERVRDAVAAAVPGDVLVLTREGFIAREVAYWNGSTPIGFVFTFGVLIGFIVGGIIVYQILFSDVQDHLREYATLKAMGYTHGYLVGVVLQEATLLAIFGFVPGALVAIGVYAQAGAATHLPMAMTASRALLVFALTVTMCGVSGVIALRKLRSADPASVF